MPAKGGTPHAAPAAGELLRFACLTTVAPGRTLADQCAAIAAAGCTGVETILFPSTPLAAWVQEFSQAVAEHGLTPTAVILGGLALYRPGQSAWVDEAIAALAEVGAPALITPEYRAQDPLPLLPPFPAPAPEEADQVAQAVAAIAQSCADHRVPLYLEPITQFEGRFWQTLEQVTAVCASVAGSSGVEVGVVVDSHNMNITEAQPQVAVEAAAQWIRHVHLADNNRRLPGQGHLDFGALLHALRTHGYCGWYSYECAIDALAFPAALRANIAHLRSL